MTNPTLIDIADKLNDIADDVQAHSQVLLEIAEAMSAEIEGAPAWTDIRERLPVNQAPDEAWMVANGVTDWWVRAPEQIDGITIHHVASNGNPYVTANYITKPVKNGGKGLPRTQYNFWIEPSGEIIYCLDLRYGPWHDNCGHRNTHVSIALNGALHKTRPTQAALTAAARLAAWLMTEYGIEIANVSGHNEWAMRCLGLTKNFTQCPGWTSMPPFWKTDFFAALQEARGTATRTGAASFGLVVDAGPSEDELGELDAMGMGNEDM